MNTTTTIARPTTQHLNPTSRTTWMRRVFGVVARPKSYYRIGYLLLGLPLGTIWFTVLVTGVAVGVSLLVVALVGIPVLWGMWYVSRAFANVERATTNVLLGEHLDSSPLASSHRGNVWVRLRAMSHDHDRWREVAYLMLRFPVGIATFTIAVTALATPVVVAYAPFSARYGGDHPFGEWSQSSRIEDIASSPWAWLLIPLGLVLLVAAFHLLNALANACGRWARSWLANGVSGAHPGCTETLR